MKRFSVRYVRYYEPVPPHHNYLCHVILDEELKMAYPFPTEAQARRQLEQVMKGGLDYLEKFGFAGGPIAETCIFLDPVTPTPTGAAPSAPKKKRGGRKPVDHKRKFVSVKLPKAFQMSMTNEYMKKRGQMLARILWRECPVGLLREMNAEIEVLKNKVSDTTKTVLNRITGNKAYDDTKTV